MTREILSLIILAATLLIAAEAVAEETTWGTPVTLPQRALLQLPECAEPPYVEEDLVGTLRVELLSAGIELVGSLDPPEADASLIVESPECTAASIVLRVRHLESGRETSRSIFLGDRPLRDRSRVLALALSELLRGRWASLSAMLREGQPEAPQEQQVVPAIDEEALRRRATEDALQAFEERREEERMELHRLHLGLVADVLVFPGNDSGLFGGRLGLDVTLSERIPIHLGFDAGYRRGGGSDQIGDVVTQTATGGVTARYQGGPDRVTGGLGLRLELGWGWVEGDPILPGFLPGHGDGFLLTLSLDGVVTIRLSPRVAMVFGFSAGWVLVGLDPRAAEHHVGGVTGPFILSSLGIAIGI